MTDHDRNRKRLREELARFVHTQGQHAAVLHFALGRSTLDHYLDRPDLIPLHACLELRAGLNRALVTPTVDSAQPL